MHYDLHKFIGTFFAYRYSGEIPLDMSAVLRQSSPQIPILIIYSTERDTAEKLVFEFANRKQVKTLVAHLSGSGASEDRTVKRLLAKGMKEVTFALQNAICRTISSLFSVSVQLIIVETNPTCAVFIHNIEK